MTDKSIDKDRLLELAAQPNSTLESISDELGVHYTTIYHRFKNDPELKAEYDAVRASRPKEKRTTKERASKRARKNGKGSTPPRNGNASSKLDTKTFFRKLALEFQHIDLYGAVSEHFDDLRSELTAVAG